MKEIPLTKGKVAIVDDEDYAELSQYKWHYSGKYARRDVFSSDGKKYVWMHRIVAGTPDGMDTDHINGNKLDNRRANLRHATREQNCHNRLKPRLFTSSKYKGVYFEGKRPRKWRAQIVFNRSRISLGSFATEYEAAKAYNEAAIRLFGNYASINSID